MNLNWFKLNISNEEHYSIKNGKYPKLRRLAKKKMNLKNARKVKNDMNEKYEMKVKNT